MSLYRRKEAPICAMEYTGHNADEIGKFIEKHVVALSTGEIFMDTDMGTATVKPGTFIIKPRNGKAYPCHPAVFHEMYEYIGEE